jgi:hypothetical protein
MKLEAKKLLFDVITACRDIEQFTAGKTFGDYLGSELLRSAVERKFGIIGEARKAGYQIDAATRQCPGIPFAGTTCFKFRFVSSPLIPPRHRSQPIVVLRTPHFPPTLDFEKPFSKEMFKLGQTEFTQIHRFWYPPGLR